jgi:hypothetical protein
MTGLNTLPKGFGQPAGIAGPSGPAHAGDDRDFGV